MSCLKKLNAEEIYPNIDWAQYEAVNDYTPFILYLKNNVDIPILIEDGNYSGDTFCLLSDTWMPIGDSKYGLLHIGWGSCTGCDRLRDCNSYEELQEYLTELVNSIKWFPSEKTIIQYIQTKDFDLDYEAHTRGGKIFIAALKQWGVRHA